MRKPADRNPRKELKKLEEMRSHFILIASRNYDSLNAHLSIKPAVKRTSVKEQSVVGMVMSMIF